MPATIRLTMSPPGSSHDTTCRGRADVAVSVCRRARIPGIDCYGSGPCRFRGVPVFHVDAGVHDLAVFGQLVRRGEAKAEVLEQAIGALISG